jgi:hypothetical protein
MMNKMLWILFIALTPPLPAQQLDKPVGPEDLVDIKNNTEKNYATQTAAIDETDRALHALIVGDSHAPNAEGATAQVLVLRCVADHSYYATVARIYNSAQQGAAQIVRDLEARTSSAASTAQVIQELQRQLDATIRREAELRASNDESSAEDLKEQADIEKNLQETIAAYRAIPATDDSGQADRMRALQMKFSLLGQDAADLVKIAETKCIAERKILGYLNLREQREKQISSWSQLLPNPSTQDRPADGQAATLPLPRR